MGLKCGHKDLSFSIKNVSLESLYNIAKERKKSKNSSNSNNENDTNNPVIDVDASYILRSALANLNDKNPVHYLIRLCKVFSSTGFDVVVVCDGASRHHSKRSTTKRLADCHRNIVCLQHEQSQLIQLRSSINDGSNTIDEATELVSQRDTAMKKIARKEKELEKTKVDVGEESFQQIRLIVSELDREFVKKTGGTIRVIRAEFQADAVLAYRCSYGQSDIMLCPDSDMIVLTGTKCLCIKTFSYNDGSKNRTVSKIELFCASVLTIDHLKTVTYIDDDQISTPKYPIFGMINDIRLRCLMSIGIGCDVLLKGVPTVTPKTLNAMLDGIHDTEQASTYTPYEWILNSFVERWKRSHINEKKEIEIIEYKIMLHVLVDTILYEPCHDDDSIIPLYLHDRPQMLHPYIEAFACTTNDIIITPSTIDCCPDMLLCVGPGSYSHYYFSQESNVRKCNKCNLNICMTCTFNINESNDYCVRCFAEETSLINSEKQQSLTYLPLNVMISELRKKGMLLNNNEDYDFVLDIYQAHETYKSVFSEDDYYKVAFPLEVTTYMNNMNIISSYDVSKGGSFMNNNDLSFDNKMELLETLISVVTDMNTDTNNDANNNNSSSTYSLFSSLMIRFAKNSRIHDGYRLLKRAIRHALDHDAIDITKAKGNIVSYNNTTAIHLMHEIKASMKSVTYHAEILFNKESLIACSCTCRCGSVGIERIVCVHVLPIIYQLSMLMYKGLAKDILYELDIFLYNKKHAIHTQQHLRQIILSLFDIIKYNDDNRRMSHNIDEMLYDFRVGTEKPKFGPGPPLDASEIGPIASLDLRSVKKRALDTIHNNNVITEPLIDSSIHATTKQMDENTYTDIVLNIIAACNIAKISHDDRIKCLDRSIGFKILLKRSKCISWNDTVTKNITKNMNNLLLEGSNFERVHPLKKVINTKMKTRSFKSSKKKSCESVSTILKPKSIKRQCCCACLRTNTKHPNLKFRKIPRTDRINKNVTTDRIRLSLAKKIKARDVILDRFGIKDERRNNTYLQFCSHHDYVYEYIWVDWIDENNIKTKSRCKLRVVLPYDKSNELIDCENNNNNDGTNSNINNNYNLYHDESFSGIIFVNEGEVVQVLDRKNPSNSFNDYALVSDEYKKEDRKDRKHNIIELQDDSDYDSNDESSSDSSYDSDDDLEMMNDHVLLYDDINENKIISNIDNNIITYYNNNTLDDDITFEQEMVEHVPKRGRRFIICNYCKCISTTNDNNIIMKVVPSKPLITTNSTNVNRGRKQYAIRLAFREECMKRIGVDDHEFGHQQTIHICNKHEVNEEEMNIEWINMKGETITERVSVNLPIQFEASIESTKRPNKGTGHQRWLLQQIRIATENREKSQDLVNRNEMISLQRVHGLEENENDNKQISTLVKNAIGLYDASKRYNLPIQINNIIDERDDNDDYNNYYNKKTKMRILELLKRNNNRRLLKLVKVRTGFDSALDLIAFIIIACNGDITIMKARTTTLSWFEEWCLYCGVAMAKNIDRWCDAEDKYHVSERTCARIFDNKQQMVLATRSSWPTYATFEEDHLFRTREKPKSDENTKSDENSDDEDSDDEDSDDKDDKNDDENVPVHDEYDNMRIVMWDNTNVDMCQPSSGKAQRLTYSVYYAGNVAKGGIFLQLCDWQGTHPLWTGAVSDTDYLVKSGILQQQVDFIQQHDHGTEEIAWTNILDRGYKVTQQAWSTGNQLVLQPVNAPTGRRFNTGETLLAAGVAAVRAGNERAVKKVKTSSYLSKGQRTHESVVRLNDMWLSYGFMINFMRD